MGPRHARPGSLNLAAACHATVYTLSFLLLAPSPTALAFIGGTHLLIDRCRLARYVACARNLSTGWRLKWADCSSIG